MAWMILDMCREICGVAGGRLAEKGDLVEKSPPFLGGGQTLRLKDCGVKLVLLFAAVNPAAQLLKFVVN